MRQLKKRYLSIILTLFMIVGLFSGVSLHTNAEETGTAPRAVSTVNAVADDTATVLAFTSDVHNRSRVVSSGTSANRLQRWLEIVKDKYNDKLECVAFGGDMADGGDTINAENYWDMTRTDMKVVSDLELESVYTTGNHEYRNGNFDTHTQDTDVVSKFIENAPARDGDDYHMYCLGSSIGRKWQEDGLKRLNHMYDDDQVTTLETYLKGIPDNDDKVIFVITHYPLHYISTRKFNDNAGKIIDVLNEAVDRGKKIVFLWGHNHTEVSKGAEKNYDRIFKPTETLTINDTNTQKTLKFYYAAAGCMCDTEYTGGGVKGKGIVITIDDAKKLSFTYYDKEGSPIVDSSFTEKDPVAVQSAAITGADGKPLASNPSVEEGSNLQLGLTTVPEDANVNSVTWESLNPDIATVDTTGKVKGLKAGKATIKAIISDGISTNSVTATLEITVTDDGSGETPETYTVTFHKNGYGTEPDPIPNVKSGSTIEEPDALSEEGWIFEGWYKEENCVNKWDFATDKVTQNTDLYAKWTKAGEEDPVGTETYELTNKMEAGKKYLIATGKEGSVYLLSAQSDNTVKGVQATVNDKKIKISKEQEETTLFTADGSDENTILLKIGESYLYADSSISLSMVAKGSIANGKYWHYREKDNNDKDINLLWFYRGTDGDYGYTGTTYHKYYLTWDTNGNFAKGTLENEETFVNPSKAVQKIYLFAKSGDEPEPHTHVYGAPVWNWEKDYSKATATFTCTCGDTQTVTDSAPAETVVTQATCTGNKVVMYKATVTFNKTSYTDETDNITIAGSALGHNWGDWVVTKPATQTEEGVETRTCSRCHLEETRPIKKLDPTPAPSPTPAPNPNNKTTPAADPSKNPAKMGKDGTPLGEGASLAAAEKAILSLPNDNDPAGTQFSKLTLRSPKQTKFSIKLSWTKPGNAKTFIVYGNNCGKTNKPKKLASVTGTSLTINSISGKKLGKGKYCKFIVLALDGRNMVVTTSKIIHVTTKGGKVGNDKSISVDKSVIKKAKKLKAGKSLKVEAKAVPQSKKLKVKKHVAVRYESTDATIATVTKKGKITAKKKGTCNVYAYAQDGVFKKIKVVVK